MAVACPACGKLSQDEEFCDYCNGDLARPLERLAPAHCPVGESGVNLTEENRAYLAMAHQPLLVQAEGKSWRVHWVPPAVYARRRGDLDERERRHNPALPPCRRIEESGGAWVLVESTGRFTAPWLDRSADPIEDLARMIDFLERLARVLEVFHQASLVWLNFDPAMLEDSDDPLGLRVTNLDMQVFPHGALPHELRVHSCFAAPEAVRFQADLIGPRTDVYHSAIFGYYWLADLLPGGFAGQGLDAFHYVIPPLRVYAPWLPPGVQRVLQCGLSLEPAKRFENPTALVHALGDVLGRARRRWAPREPVAWDVGYHSRIGRAKTPLEKGNEDKALVRAFANPARVLALVADGISTCDVGSGGLASLIATMIIENQFGPDTQEGDFLAQVEPACRRASQTLLDWALEKGYGPELVEGVDLMGTTLTVAWLQGRYLAIANLGDSRAYLVDEHGAEQLTVDGDLASGLLSEGTPPEEIMDLGLVGKALRQCIGGCTVSPEGRVQIMEDSCQPSITCWPLLPGDVVILCTDGLIEEDLFLEPDQLADIVGESQELSAAELAIRLAEEADRLQRPPSDQEPEGFGDNISCVVIRIK